jgi:hypothetical protein
VTHRSCRGGESQDRLAKEGLRRAGRCSQELQPTTPPPQITIPPQQTNAADEVVFGAMIGAMVLAVASLVLWILSHL